MQRGRAPWASPRVGAEHGDFLSTRVTSSGAGRGLPASLCSTGHFVSVYRTPPRGQGERCSLPEGPACPRLLQAVLGGSVQQQGGDTWVPRAALGREGTRIEAQGPVASQALPDCPAATERPSRTLPCSLTPPGPPRAFCYLQGDRPLPGTQFPSPSSSPALIRPQGAASVSPPPSILPCPAHTLIWLWGLSGRDTDRAVLRSLGDSGPSPLRSGLLPVHGGPAPAEWLDGTTVTAGDSSPSM